MPAYVVTRIADALNDRGKPVKGSRVTLLGMAYKKDVDDPRESPGFELMELLLKKDVKLESKDRDGQTPLSLAAERGDEAVVELLLKKGAELESKDDDGQTPLFYAAGNTDDAVVKLLLKNGAKLESRDKYGRTPLSRAVARGRKAIVKLLLEKGADNPQIT